MKRSFAEILTAVLLLGLAGSGGFCSDFVDFVDPMIGTANTGQTFPAVGLPFAMTQWTPQTQDTENKCISPYYYKDTKIQGFRGTHFWSGSCTQDYGSVTVMPMTGPLKVSPAARASSFRHGDETASPDCYCAVLSDYGVRAEMTGLSRSSILRFTFPLSEDAIVLVHPNPKKGEGTVRIIPEKREIVGTNPVHRIYQGSGKPAGFSGYFVAVFDQPFAGYGTWSGETVHPNRLEQNGENGSPGAFVKFNPSGNRMVHVRIGTSFTSVENARENLEKEIPSFAFERTRRVVRETWKEALGRISLRGGTREQKINFYTSLYHALLMPRTFSDADGSYPKFAGGDSLCVANGFTYYDDFSLWDTFRALHPLLILVEPPARIRDMVLSLLAKADQGGWLPNFPGWNSYTSAMIGDHAVSMVVDAYLKGIRGFDAAHAYAVMRKNATESPADQAEYLDGKGRRALPAYLKHGYIPVEEEVREAFHKREQTSRTLEYCYDDFVLSQMAKSLGKAGDASLFLSRAYNYQNVFDSTTGFVRGRHVDGSWVVPFDPTKAQPYITEGTPWQYTWFVPHDVHGLIRLMGGRTAFVAKLDTFFEKQYYWHGNEPSHQIAYLYDYAGVPWKTQQRVRDVLKREYHVGPDGLSGNDDTGQMSAWYVFSALGFYPVCPGSPHYEIGSPIFEEVRIRLGNGKLFIIRAEGVSDENRFIQSAELNGKTYGRPWISHEDLARGGTMVFQMGSTANKLWGCKPENAPPSLSQPQ